MAKRENVPKSLVHRTGISRELRETFYDDEKLDALAEVNDPNVVQILNIVAKASILGVDDALFKSVFRDIAYLSIEITEDKKEADCQRRLLVLAETDPELAKSSSWNTGCGSAVSAFINEMIFTDGINSTRHTFRCQSVFATLRGGLRKYGPEVIARCKEIVERHLSAQTEALNKLRQMSTKRTRSAVHDDLRKNA